MIQYMLEFAPADIYNLDKFMPVGRLVALVHTDDEKRQPVVIIRHLNQMNVFIFVLI